MLHAAHFHYHSKRLTELKRLYWSHSIRLLASNMTLIFAPIYLYKLHYSLTAILGYFFIANVFGLIMLYPAMKWSNHIGAHKAMGVSLVFQSLSSLMIATLPLHAWPLWLMAIVQSAAWFLYWPNFRACFAKGLFHKKAGKAAGISAALTTLVYGVAPAIGGIIATGFGIATLYVFSVACFVCAAIILFKSEELVQKEEFNLKSLSIGKIKRDLLANMGDTVDDDILGIIWPLFIFLIIPSYAGVGILSSISVIAGIMIALYIGRHEKNRGPLSYLKSGAWITGATNGIRIITQSASQIAGVNFINGIGHAIMGTPFNARYYENASRESLLPYIFWMNVAAWLSSVILFGVILVLSLFMPIKTVLLIGLLFGVPAGLGVRLIR